MSANAGSSAARAAIRAERISFYVAMGGPGMPNARAAELLGVAVKTVQRYRGELLAAGVITRRPGGPPPAEPCGTIAAVRRHYRRGEDPCPGCRMAAARAWADRDQAGQAGTLTPDYREKRNNMPDVPLYRWRPRGDRPAYPWAARAIAAAEAVYGSPEPTCTCGAPLEERRARNPGGRCQACEPDMLVVPARPGQVHYASGAGPACHNGGANPQLTDEPRLVTCENCERTTARLNELAARMVSS